MGYDQSRYWVIREFGLRGCVPVSMALVFLYEVDYQCMAQRSLAIFSLTMGIVWLYTKRSLATKQVRCNRDIVYENRILRLSLYLLKTSDYDIAVPMLRLFHVVRPSQAILSSTPVPLRARQDSDISAMCSSGEHRAVTRQKVPSFSSQYARLSDLGLILWSADISA